MSDLAEAGLAPIQQAAPLRSRIIDAMRRAIERGTLKPGERLVEKDLCQQLAVSRTSLREALRELEAEGVVAQSGARGLTVVRISRRDAENIYLIRADLEALIFNQFLETENNAALTEADRLCKALIGAYRGGEFITIIEAKRALYDHICNVADNAVAHNLLMRLTLRTAQLRSRSVVRPERQVQSIREIEALRDALLARDSKAASKAAREHVENAALSALPFAVEEP